MFYNFIDTHCHLDSPKLINQVDEIVNRALDSNVKYIISIGTGVTSSFKVIQFCEKYEKIFGTVGLDPHNAKLWNDKYIIAFNKFAQHRKIVAIGETGLDFYYFHSSKSQQEHALREQLKLAIDLNLPIILHNRESDNELLAILDEFKAYEKIPVIVHSFASNSNFAKECIKRNIILSYSGMVTFKRAHHIRESLAITPLDNLLIETDSPYLAPVPKRGLTNEPSFVIYTYKYISDFLNINLFKLAEIVENNAKKIFKKIVEYERN